MSPNTPEAWPPPPTLPPPTQEQNVRWKLPLVLPADRNWLVSFDDSEIVFRRPGKQRIIGASAYMLLLLYAIMSWPYEYCNMAHNTVQGVTYWTVLMVGTALGPYLATPNSLTLDLQSRTYRFRYVPLLVPKVVTEPLTDIASLAIVDGYTIELRWSEAVAKSRPRPTLGQYGKKPADAVAARKLMRRVAAKLAVPCAYPYLFHINYPEAQAE